MNRPGEQPPTLPGSLLERYRIQKFLGGGSFGKVWLAQDLKLGRPVAVKILNRLPKERRHEQSVESEARIVAQMSHPNIVSLFDFEMIDGTGFLFLDYVPGQSLKPHVFASQRLETSIAVQYVAHLARALAFAHESGILHLDVKPENALIDLRTDLCKLTDFGLGKRVGTSEDQEESPGGTPPYMAPDLLSPEGLTSASDVYALAVTLFQLLTLEFPYRYDSQTHWLRHLAEKRTPLPTQDLRLKRFPLELVELVRSGLDPNPHGRPSAKQMAIQLELFKPVASLSSTVIAQQDGPVQLRLRLVRHVDSRAFEVIGSRRSTIRRRDMQLGGQPDESVALSTGDVVRVEVESSHPGYLALLNIGPRQNVNLLYSSQSQSTLSGTPQVESSIQIPAIEMTPPAGHEQLAAIWSVRPFPDDPQEFLRFVVSAGIVDSRGSQRTRDMQLKADAIPVPASVDWLVSVMQIAHQ